MDEIWVAWIFAIIIVLIVVGPPSVWLMSRPDPISSITTEEDEQEWQNESQDELMRLEEMDEDVPTLLQKEPKKP